MGKDPQEWLKQADYDIDTAEFMCSGDRNMYAVFMCHLSVEKALKGIYQKRSSAVPPRTHNLVFLAEKAQIEFPQALSDFIFSLNHAAVPTRYPDDLQRMLKDYNKEKTREIVDKSKEVLKWLKTLY
jgi:HEPN domain-containing protein